MSVSTREPKHNRIWANPEGPECRAGDREPQSLPLHWSAFAPTENRMQNGLIRFALVGALVLLGFIAAQPYIEHRLYATTTPRPVEARGNLAEFERLTIDIFEH